MIRKLNYLTVTRLNISFVVSCASGISWFPENPYHDHWVAAMRILYYLKGALGKGLSFHDLKYLLGIEVVYSGEDSYISQHKYALGMLEHLNMLGMLGSKVVDISMDSNIRSIPE